LPASIRRFTAATVQLQIIVPFHSSCMRKACAATASMASPMNTSRAGGRGWSCTPNLAQRVREPNRLRQRFSL
jgi:hypothetical protein